MRDATSDLGSNRAGILAKESLDGEDTNVALRIRLELAVVDPHMKVHIKVQRGAETVSEGHRTDLVSQLHPLTLRARVAFD